MENRIEICRYHTKNNETCDAGTCQTKPCYLIQEIRKDEEKIDGFLSCQEHLLMYVNSLSKIL